MLLGIWHSENPVDFPCHGPRKLGNLLPTHMPRSEPMEPANVDWCCPTSRVCLMRLWCNLSQADPEIEICRESFRVGISCKCMRWTVEPQCNDGLLWQNREVMHVFVDSQVRLLSQAYHYCKWLDFHICSLAIKQWKGKIHHLLPWYSHFYAHLVRGFHSWPWRVECATAIQVADHRWQVSQVSTHMK